MRKLTKKGFENKLDDLWRKSVYKQGRNCCEYCGAVGQLNAHHIFSRSNSAVRWELQNGVCLCPLHHVFDSRESFHKAPAEMLDWIRRKRGEAWYENLRIKARHMIKKTEAGEKARPILEAYLAEQ